MKRARPTAPTDWGLTACWLAAAFLLLWATLIADWWSTALTLDLPFKNGTSYAPLASEGRTLFEGYSWLPITLLVLMVVGANLTALVLGPYAFIKDRRFLVGSVAIGVVGVALTVVASQLDSPVAGLVATNAWIPASLAWLVYFGAIVVALVAQDPQLELDTRPDSSDG